MKSVLFCIIIIVLAAAVAESASFQLIQGPAVGITQEDRGTLRIPFIDANQIFVNGHIIDYHGKAVNITSPILDLETKEPVVIGRLSQMAEEDLPAVMEGARKAWDRGQGTWPQMTFAQRIAALERVVAQLQQRREEIVDVLMWEICKSYKDAASEFDRTMVFISSVIEAFRDMDGKEVSWRSVEGILAIVRRAAIGIMLCVGPFNYPFNETYATLIPALLMGNVVIMKIPTIGGLAHMLTMQAYAQELPPGVLQFVTGSGRTLLAPLMQTGDIDILAFIGGSKAADQLIKAHPHVHRLKVFLQLEGKNLGVLHQDLADSPAALEEALDQVMLGALSYNGQRCTALKLLFVHDQIVEKVLAGLAQRINALPFGLPWLPSVSITPLPGHKRVDFFLSLIDEAVRGGAKIVNAPEGGTVQGNLLRPALLYPVDPSMKLYWEEQFGPVVPVVSYSNLSQVIAYAKQSEQAQQVSLFSQSSAALSLLVDSFSTIVGRVNINTQAGRSPDSLPFSGRRSSAQGTMSVTEALRTFSIEVLLAGKESVGNNKKIMGEIGEKTRFLAPLDSEERSSSQQEL